MPFIFIFNITWGILMIVVGVCGACSHLIKQKEKALTDWNYGTEVSLYRDGVYLKTVDKGEAFDKILSDK